jgi:hypothetical protein
MKGDEAINNVVPYDPKRYLLFMSVAELLQEIEALPSEERLRLVEKLVKLTENDVPESLRESMAQAARGELIDLDEALKELDGPSFINLLS